MLYEIIRQSENGDTYLIEVYAHLSTARKVAKTLSESGEIFFVGIHGDTMDYPYMYQNGGLINH